MDAKVIEEMNKLIDRYFGASNLHVLLKDFIQDKVQEQSIWSEITLSIHFMLGGESPHIYRMAALVELVILSLDMLDDLQDDDHADKPWMKCGRENTMNAVVGLLMVTLADTGQGEKSSVKSITRTITTSVMRAICGQHKDLNDTIHSEEDYITMVKEKSGSLVQLACQMGIICLDYVDNDIEKRVAEMATYIGIMAQLDNDRADMMKLDVKNDILIKKRTLPIMFLLSVCEEKFPQLLEYYKGTLSQSEFLNYKTELLTFMVDSGAIEYAKTIQMLYLHKAEQIFETLPAHSPWNLRFKEIVFRSDDK